MGIGGAANTLGDLIRLSTFMPNGYWRCRQYPGGSSYIFIVLCARDIGVAANRPGGFIRFSTCRDVESLYTFR